jgi:predicted nucleic acid-binding protein
MFLLDTNVISALAPSKRAAAAELAVWLDRASPYLFLSAITAAEVAAGVAKAEREGAGAKARALAEWWQAVEHFYGARVLPFDLRCAQRAARRAPARSSACASTRFRRHRHRCDRGCARLDCADQKSAAFHASRRPGARSVSGAATAA